MTPLPIEAVLPELRTSFLTRLNCVLSAEPGAGKTTRVPPALLEEPWCRGKSIILLEPRRIAATRAAGYMAQLLGEPVGETVGYRIRGETKVGARTRIEVVTEGVLTRLLHADHALGGTALVIFDEFHERSIHADLGLALALDVQQHHRPDLRILVMSATMDGLALAAMMHETAMISSTGTLFPVETRYLEHPVTGNIEPVIAATTRKALRAHRGDILVFVPGQREIRRVEALLQHEDLPDAVHIHLLYGDAPLSAQQEALRPAPHGERKVIIATSVAETSLTIEGVGVVIDSGQARMSQFDPRRGMSGLVTTVVSRAAADQRQGRAGRQQAGVCYRLWTENQLLPPFRPPEITTTDLAGFVLDVTRWGNRERLRFLDPPPAAHEMQARMVLGGLGAIHRDGTVTEHGRAMSELPVHPRLAHLLLRGKELGLGGLACDIAALLEERDPLRGERDRDIDLGSRLHMLWDARGRDIDRIRQQAARLRLMVNVPEERKSIDDAGLLLALAYPERVARRRDGHRYQMAGGTGAVVPESSLMAREQYLAVADVDASGAEARIFLAAPISEEQIRDVFQDQLTVADDVHWDPRRESVVALRATQLGALTLSAVQLVDAHEEILAAVLDGIRSLGLDALPWTKESRSLRNRSEWLRLGGLVPTDWPDLSESGLLDTLESWLAPYLQGITNRGQLQRIDLTTIVHTLVSFRRVPVIDRLAPTHIVAPTGSRIPVEYAPGAEPTLSVRLQEMFGETRTPVVGGGKVPVVLHLLSPAGRPLAVTKDLPSFWRQGYLHARKDMRGKYPKHHWPEDPLTAAPTRRAKSRRNR